MSPRDCRRQGEETLGSGDGSMGGSARVETEEGPEQGPLSPTMEEVDPGGEQGTTVSPNNQTAQALEETALPGSGEETQQAAPSTSYDPTPDEGEMEGE